MEKTQQKTENLDWSAHREPKSNANYRESDLPKVDAPRIQTEAHESADAKPSSSEMRAGPGFRVNLNFDGVTKAQIDQLSQFETTEISDALNRMFTMNPKIRNVVDEQPLFGRAVTVKVFPGDNLMAHKALDIIKPGDVMVIDTSGEPRNAVVGDMIGNKAKHRGAAGFIIDGLVRDLSGLREIGLPVYATGITAFGPLHRGPGELGYSISCGGIVVNPGDAICADSSGVVVVRQESADDTINYLKSHRDNLAEYVANVKRGKFSNDWVDDQLSQDGCLLK